MATAFEQLKQKSVQGAAGSAPNVPVSVPTSAFESLKQKASVTTPTTQQSTQEPTFGDFVKKDIQGQATEADRPTGFAKSLGTSVFQSTLGSEGLTGLSQAPVRPVATAVMAGAQEDIQASRKRLSDSANSYISMAQSEQDPTRKRKLLDLARSTIQETEGMAKVSQDVNAVTPQSTSIGGDLKRIAGQAINTALTFAPAAKTMQAGKAVAAIPSGFSAPAIQKGLQAVGMGANTASKVVSVGKNIVPRIVESAGFGAGYGGANALAEEKSMGEVAQSALVGGAFGAAIPVAGAVVKKAVGGVVNKIKPSADTAVNELRSVWEKLFRATKTGTKKFEKGVRFDRDASEFLAKKGEMPNIVGNKYDTTGTVKKLADDVEYLESILSENAKLSKAKVGVKEFKNLVLKAIDNPTNRAEGTIAQKRNEIIRLFKEFKKSYGDKIKLEDIQKIKTQQGKLSKVFDAAKPKFAQDVNYQVSKTARKLFEQKMVGTPVEAFNKQVGQYMNAIEMLNTINGNVVKGGRLGQYVGRTVGAIAGSQGGFFGTISGMVVGDRVAATLSKLSAGSPILRAAIKRLPKATPPEVVSLLENVRVKSPEAYKELIQELSRSQIIQPIIKAATNSNSPILNSIPLILRETYKRIGG